MKGQEHILVLSLKETIIINIKDIPKVEKISKAFENLLELSYLGSQYDWLGRFAYSKKLTDLELSIHFDDKAQKFIEGEVEKIEKQGDAYYKLKENYNNPDLFIFSYYHFPLLAMTKSEMEKLATENNFDDIMERTWFCHSPYRGKPCGMCNPCIYTKEEGLGRRVPKPSPLVFLFRKGKSQLKNAIK